MADVVTALYSSGLVVSIFATARAANEFQSEIVSVGIIIYRPVKSFGLCIGEITAEGAIT